MSVTLILSKKYKDLWVDITALFNEDTHYYSSHPTIELELEEASATPTLSEPMHEDAAHPFLVVASMAYIKQLVFAQVLACIGIRPGKN